MSNPEKLAEWLQHENDCLKHKVRELESSRSPGCYVGDVERIVRLALDISKGHWLKHGTPIKPEDSGAVTIDVLARLEQDT